MKKETREEKRSRCEKLVRDIMIRSGLRQCTTAQLKAELKKRDRRKGKK